MLAAAQGFFFKVAYNFCMLTLCHSFSARGITAGTRAHFGKLIQTGTRIPSLQATC